MAVRATWRGFLKLSLVSCPIRLYPATSANSKVRFNMLNRETGNRLRQQYVDAETGALVEKEQRIKGYQVGKDEYVRIEPTELEDIKIESERTIEIDSFVEKGQVDQVYCDSPYFIAPDGKVGQEAFAVIREAMRKKKMVGIGRVVLSSREHPIMLEPHGVGIRAMTLRYPAEIRSEEAYFEDIADIKVSKELLDLAETIVDGKAEDFDPSQFVDHYEDALVKMIEDKKAGRKIKKAEAPRQSNTINLADALRAAVKADGGKKKKMKRAA